MKITKEEAFEIFWQETQKFSDGRELPREKIAAAAFYTAWRIVKEDVADKMKKALEKTLEEL